jgi:hypothetical protein
MDALFEGSTVAEALRQLVDPGAENRPRLVVGIRQFVHRHRKHAMQACWLEKNHEGLDFTCKSQSNPTMGLETHNLDPLTGFYEGPITPVDLICVSKLKFNERRGPGWDRVNHRGVPYKPFQVRIQANIVG